MKIPIFEASPNLMITNRSGKKSDQGMGFFGDILNMKLQSFQAETATNAEETAEVRTDMAQLLASVLGELQEQIGPRLSEDEQELLQQSIDLLRGTDEEHLDTLVMIGPVLEKIAGAVESLISESEVNKEEVQLILEELKTALKQYETINQTSSPAFPKSADLPIFITGHIPVRQTISSSTDTESEKADSNSNSFKQGTGMLSSEQEHLDTDEARPVSVRLESPNAPKEAASATTSTPHGNDGKGTETGNVQSKAEASQALASNSNRNEIEEAIVRLAETGSNERKSRELIRQFTNVLQKSHFSQALQTKSLTIRLYPEHLGSLRIELIQKDGAMIARILASTNMAKDMLDSQIHQLRQAFVQQNIQVDKVDVSFQEGLDKYTSQDQRGRDQEQPSSDQSADKDGFTGETDEEDFSKFLQKVLFEMEV